MNDFKGVKLMWRPVDMSRALGVPVWTINAVIQEGEFEPRSLGPEKVYSQSVYNEVAKRVLK